MFWIICFLNLDQGNWYTNWIRHRPFCSNFFFFCITKANLIRKAKQDELIQARKFNNISQFIEDLTATNDDDEFERHIKKFAIQS